MNTTTNLTDVVRVQAYYGVTKKLGRWTTARQFEVRAARSTVVLDLRSPEIAAGEIEINLDIDHAMVKLLVPEDATIEHWDVRRAGRGRVKDWTNGNPNGAPVAGARVIRLVGDIRQGEVRIHRGGIAQLSALFSRQFVEDARQAHREGGVVTVDDPTRTA